MNVLVMARKNSTAVTVWSGMRLKVFNRWLDADAAVEEEIKAAREQMK
ncbi:MAG: hypothetical protein IK104_01130 [Clostridia bacterium]|nr:hypothetical protein [Clostridia bacterium]